MTELRLGAIAMFATMFVSGAALAQQPANAPQGTNDQRTVAKLIDIEGTVLVSEGDAMAAGAKDQRLKLNTRVVTTAGAKVTINYDKGCDVRLDENKRFTVRELGECALLIASVEDLAAPVAAAAGGGGVSGLAIGGAVAAGAAAIYGVSRAGGTNVSPN